MKLSSVGARYCAALLFTTLCAASAQGQGTISVVISTSIGSPQPIGSSVVINATATDSGSGPVSYKFEFKAPGSTTYSLLRDFDITNNFTWVPTRKVGIYTLQVTARDYAAGVTSTPATLSFGIKSLVTAGVPVVNSTQHPLVALFSAPACSSGSSMRVKFQGVNATSVFYTDFRPCTTASMNFLIGGMRPSSVYNMHFQTATGTTIVDDTHVLQYTTGAIASGVTLPRIGYPVPYNSGTSVAEKVTLFAPGIGVPAFGTDFSGNYIWYYADPAIDQLTRPVEGGTILVFLAGTGSGTGYFGPTNQRQQILREIDLAGNTLRETNASRISEQLPTLDLPNGIDRFSHEARKLPNGNYLVLGEAQTIEPPGVQGANATDVLGAVILVLDPNFQVLWYWNSFDHDSGGTQLDISRQALLNEQCIEASGTGGRGCPDVLLSSPANDWLHANALQYLSDGSILLSMRNQDWVAKVDYGNGTGSGNVLWRMGRDGDFTFTGSTDPWPWFSGQHDPEFQNDQLIEMSVFDDGNTRINQDGGNSRGQVLSVDELSMTVGFILNADLGAVSNLLGSAEPLANGDWAFDNGDINFRSAQNIELNPSGVTTFNEATASPAYRAFRMTDFYNVPQT